MPLENVVQIDPKNSNLQKNFEQKFENFEKKFENFEKNFEIFFFSSGVSIPTKLTMGNSNFEKNFEKNHF